MDGRTYRSHDPQQAASIYYYMMNRARHGIQGSQSLFTGNLRQAVFLMLKEVPSLTMLTPLRDVASGIFQSHHNCARKTAARVNPSCWSLALAHQAAGRSSPIDTSAAKPLRQLGLSNAISAASRAPSLAAAPRVRACAEPTISTRKNLVGCTAGTTARVYSTPSQPRLITRRCSRSRRA